MNNRSFYLRYKKYLKVSLFQCLGVVMILHVGIARRAKILKFLSDVFNVEDMHTRVILIFSRSWSSHGLEVSATDDLRRVATKLTIKVCCFRA